MSPAILEAAPTLRKFLISNIKIKKKISREINDAHKPEKVNFDFFCPTSSLHIFLIVWAFIINFMSVERSIT